MRPLRETNSLTITIATAVFTLETFEAILGPTSYRLIIIPDKIVFNLRILQINEFPFDNERK